MKHPDVTVVIPCFNSAETLGAAIASAIRQNKVSVEVIVVDDCSQDNSMEIAKSFPAHIVKVHQHKENRGPGAARNTALTNARGTWLAMLDSDDTFECDRVHQMISHAEAANAQIVVDNPIIISGTGEKQSTMFPEESWAQLTSIDLADFILGNTLFSSKFNLGYLKPVIRRDFVIENSLNYDEHLRIGEDYLFASMALAKGADCRVCQIAGYNYHIRDGSISRVLKLHHLYDMRTADRAFRARVDLNSVEQNAFKIRAKSIEEAISFLKLVGHIKARSPIKILKTILNNPLAARHLRMPIAARWQRWVAS